ncbi:hypothetical protein SAMN05660479_01103 [Microbulbifer thermotolerans]|uniref:Uncharacterized protein n=1 Tax=Microbulbifer thermotolerans TaxID=252514 RepID=A0A143HPX4_MICTH|nr:hypothetical protein [Microbulbifer thermotolerans]AMX03769.1 hypothetical protein A3224_15285 [Microbulbifer thermotolerans]MCX2780711.1 hypothetical protein [Microbulbifer thermotolerans]MCX2842020.1 hypothetical protein [Microbulbifer thermotolerans]SFC09521.1 hypothetical protein SAMN05660479_01103 [Microbulbifer thermotolerans]
MFPIDCINLARMPVSGLTETVTALPKVSINSPKGPSSSLVRYFGVLFALTENNAFSPVAGKAR